MDQPRTTDPPPLGPTFTPEEREERTCLDYFLRELGRLRDRGLVPEGSFATIVGEASARRDRIERRGSARSALERVRQLAPSDPKAAVYWAERARTIDPDEPEGWVLSIALHRRLRDPDRAIALCDEAAGRFAEFPVSPTRLRAEIEAEPAEDVLALARDALQRGDDAEVAALCNRMLADQPEHVDSLVLLAFALQRAGRLDEALAAYQRIAALQPGNPVWSRWIRNVEDRRKESAGPVAPRLVEVTRKPVAPVAPVTPSAPRLSWSSVSREFLLDHWQVILSGMAVLLIVVSSNIGAAQILGEKLWSPVGKTVLALVYTSMFAAFGIGLVRWGAARAGRIMLLTTLIVVPANFMLAGTMKLVTNPTGYGLALLAIDAASLLVLIRAVTSALGARRGAWPLSVALFTLSAFNAAAAPEMTWPFGWQFALFLAPSVVFLAAVTWLNTRFDGDGFEDRGVATYAALGLFLFAFLTGVARTGAFVLELPPALYAIPVMVAGLAVAQTAGRLGRFDPDPNRAIWGRYIGVLLSIAAFALALARPPVLSPLFSGNTLSIAFMGLGLYAYLLRKERQPAYLYLGFGALIAAYFGAFYFVRDLVHTVEEVARQALGYQQPLPQPFKAINGLVFSTVLAGLSRTFKKGWGDERLARHCHLIGVPFAIICCLISALEPKAAVICLSGYTLLFAMAVWVFAAPRVTYLAATALAGAAYFGATLAPGATLAEASLVIALIALGEWAIERFLRFRGVDEAYRRPLGHVSLAMGALAMAAAGGSALLPSGVTTPAALAFAVVALVAVLLNRESPGKVLAYVAAVSGSLGYAFFVLAASHRYGAGLNKAEDAVAAGAAGFILATLAHWLGRTSATLARRAVYPGPMAHVAFVHVGFAVLFGALHLVDLGTTLPGRDDLTLAAAAALSGATLATLSFRYPHPVLPHLSLLFGLGAWLGLARAALGAKVGAMVDHAALGAGYALFLAILDETARQVLARRKAGPADPELAAPTPSRIGPLFRAAPDFAAWLTVATAILAAIGYDDGRNTAIAFALGSAAVLLTTRLRPRPRWLDLGLALAVLAVLSLTAWRVGLVARQDDVAGWLALAAGASALAIRFLGVQAERSPFGAFHAEGCHRAVGATAWLVLLLGVVGPMFSSRTYVASAGGLALSALALLSLTTSRARPALTYRAVVATVAAIYVILFNIGKGSPATAFVPGLVAVATALLLETAGFVGRAWAGERPEPDRLYFRPAFRSSLVMTVLGIVMLHQVVSIEPARLATVASMVLAGASFLGLVKGWPSRSWLYATIGVWCVALHAGVLRDWPSERLVTAAMVVAYQLWLVGLLVRRFEPALVRGLRLPQTGYEHPIVHCALAAAGVATCLRVQETLDGPLVWTDSAGLTLNLAVFALAIVKVYPSRFWVHVSAALATLSAAMAAAPLVASRAWFLTLAMGLALVWQGLAWVWRRYEGPIGRAVRLAPGGYPGVPRAWSLGTFGLGFLAVAALVAHQTAMGILWRDSGSEVSPAGWPAILIALALGGVFVALEWGRSRPVDALPGGFVVVVLAVWWLFAPASPLLARFGLTSGVCLPLATSVLALAGVTGAVGWVKRPSEHVSIDVFHVGEGPWERLDAFLMDLGRFLAVLSAAMTLGVTSPATVATLGLATLALGLAAFARGGVGSAYAAGLIGCWAGLEGALEVVRRFPGGSGSDRVLATAVGLFAAVLALWAAAGLLRKRAGRDPSSELDVLDPTDLPARSVAIAFEQVALLASAFCASGVVATLFLPARPLDRSAMAGVGVLFGLALVAVGLLRRWRVAWLVYAGQSALLGSYLYYRWAFPIPATTDAVVLVLFGYLDFGLAEAMHRVGFGDYARATRRFALVVPLIPLGLTFWNHALDENGLFVLFTAATFYGVACYRLQSRPVGYAAAVLYNGFLWVLWARVGWTLADRPQFFLAPVGLTAILFAEVNRGSLPKSALNAIRGIGLSTIYVSLAVPIWQFQSLGAWVTLLLVSLAGVLVGIGLRVQTFLWLGLTGFVLDVVYQLGRVGMENTLAKWGIMLGLGVLIMLFVALNEKKRIVETMRNYYEEARGWE